MSKEAALRKAVGDKMLQSIGATPVSTNGAAPRPVIPMTSEHDGRKRFHEAGLMELDRIIPDPNQVRKEFPEAAIQELSGSIKTYGVMSPLEVRWDETLGKHVIIHGERRYRAAKLAGLLEVPCIFKKDGELTQDEIVLRQLTENCLREDLTPREQADAFKALMDMQGWNAQELASRLSLSKSLITTRLSILELPEDVREMVGETLSGDQAYEISKLPDEKVQREVIQEIETKKLTRDETRDLVREKRGKEKAAAPKVGRPTTRQDFKLGSGGKWTLTLHKKRVTKADIEKALEELTELIRAA